MAAARARLVRTPVTLVTGAGGEIGHGLITRLAGSAPSDRHHRHRAARRRPRTSWCTASSPARSPTPTCSSGCWRSSRSISSSTSRRCCRRASEFTPITAHHVNVEGTLTLLEFAQREGESHGRGVRFLYPSSIAAYGLPDLATKTRVGSVREDEWNTPRTMYGCNKLYCEHLGRYYARYYKQLAAHATGRVDFRCVRFPGLISAMTLPSGGTSDYAPEMIHAAARGEPYACFVRPDTRIPFMAMPDAVDGAAGAGRRAAGAADADGLQRQGVQSARPGDPRRRRRGVSDGVDHVGDRPQAAGDRRLVAGGRGRPGGAARLGLRAGVRFSNVRSTSI